MDICHTSINVITKEDELCRDDVQIPHPEESCELHQVFIVSMQVADDVCRRFDFKKRRLKTEKCRGVLEKLRQNRKLETRDSVWPAEEHCRAVACINRIVCLQSNKHFGSSRCKDKNKQVMMINKRWIVEWMSESSNECWEMWRSYDLCKERERSKQILCLQRNCLKKKVAPSISLRIKAYRCDGFPCS